MTDLEDEEDWAVSDEPQEEDSESNAVVSESALDRCTSTLHILPCNSTLHLLPCTLAPAPLYLRPCSAAPAPVAVPAPLHLLFCTCTSAPLQCTLHLLPGQAGVWPGGQDRVPAHHAADACHAPGEAQPVHHSPTHGNCSKPDKESKYPAVPGHGRISTLAAK